MVKPGQPSKGYRLFYLNVSFLVRDFFLYYLVDY
jgi:hypothetical protein